LLGREWGSCDFGLSLGHLWKYPVECYPVAIHIGGIVIIFGMKVIETLFFLEKFHEFEDQIDYLIRLTVHHLTMMSFKLIMVDLELLVIAIDLLDQFIHIIINILKDPDQTVNFTEHIVDLGT